ncbi:MAG: hypothetical protein R2729_01455 [Bryobacteraceae bacterium]
MPYFPQLLSGSVAQFPLARWTMTRTINGETIARERTATADTAGRRTRWQLLLSGLTAEERNAIETLFRTCEGRLRPFVFADPSGNLLANHLDLSSSPWQSDPQLQWVSDLPDAAGGTSALQATNTGSIAGSCRQAIDVPGEYVCSFSVYARSTASSSLTLSRSGGTNTDSRVYPVGQDWRRLAFSSKLPASTGPCAFAIHVPGTATVELFGAQVDAQPFPSIYRRSDAHSRLYSHAYFAQDSLDIVADGVDSFSLQLLIESREES